MAEAKSVRALERGLAVLTEVQARRGASLHELHQALALPKATLLRMLGTLIRAGFVWQRLADGAYLPHLESADATSALVEDIAELAAVHLRDLSTRAAWPSVLAVPRLDHIEIIETNSPLFRLDAATLGPVGVKLSYIHTATGRAYLAACPEPERAAIIARLRPADPPEGSEAALAAIIAETRLRGYALREPLHPWPDRTRQLVQRDGRRSLAVPIMTGGRPVAAVNLTWPARRGMEESVMLQHLALLHQTARAIGSAVAARAAGQRLRRDRGISERV